MIQTVTMTGADDNTSVAEMVRLSKEYPFVEWGILVSDKRKGSERFPSYDWIMLLLAEAKHQNPQMKLSLHLCGQIVRDFLKGNFAWINRHPSKFGMFDRVQLNTHGEPHEWNLDRVYNFIDGLPRKEFIFQYDEVNTDLIESLCRLKKPQNISTLFDASHGAGILPKQWPKHLAYIKCGYAGGLGPSNLMYEIPRIKKASEGRNTWIDMETMVRTYAEFDLFKVERCLKTFKAFTDANQN